MLRTFKATLALTMILALAACSTLTEPVSDDTTDTATIQKQAIDEPEEGSGGSTPPVEEEPQEEDASNGRGRGHKKN